VVELRVQLAPAARTRLTGVRGRVPVEIGQRGPVVGARVMGLDVRKSQSSSVWLDEPSWS
jgi:hypothetical protein